MSTEINDVFSTMESVVRFEPTVSIRFLAEELRRYGIKTNTKTDKGKTVFYQSAHILLNYESSVEEDGLKFPSYSLVSFKDLFKIIGKNDQGVDNQDIVRVWYIAERLEKRGILQISGTAKETLDTDDKPDLPDVYANTHHIHRNDTDKDEYIFKSKFASNKQYKTVDGLTLTCVADFFILSR